MKSVSGKSLCKIVERYGWNLKRITGSHHIYVKEGMSVILSIPFMVIVIYLRVHSEVF
jgi:predicted RNA binding protein YcfA (HicA-like mRNA interferase family)